MSRLFITHCLQWRNQRIRINGNPVLSLDETDARKILPEAYHELGVTYPKFFKMDLLSKLAVLSFELLNREHSISGGWNTGLAISTLHGCINVDLQFEQNRQDIPSPALFVYTLPNILLGELSIRYQIKGEQCCFIAPANAIEMPAFYTADLLRNQGMQTVFCGHIDATDAGLNATVLRVEAESVSFSKPFRESDILSLFTESF